MKTLTLLLTVSLLAGCALTEDETNCDDEIHNVRVEYGAPDHCGYADNYLRYDYWFEGRGFVFDWSGDSCSVQEEKYDSQYWRRSKGC